MSARWILVILFILMGLSLKVYSQEAVVGYLDRKKTPAGQAFPIKIHFSAAPSYAAEIRENFYWTNDRLDPVSVFCHGYAKAGNNDADLTCNVPIDANAGIYKSNPTLWIGPPPEGSRQRNEAISLPDIEVVSVQDTNTYPQHPVGTITLNQQQVLQNGAANVEHLLDYLNTRVDNGSAETPSLQAYLASVARDAQKNLEKSRSAYREASPHGSPEPIFFEDFARQYASFLTEIRAPGAGQIGRANERPSHLQLVQLETHDSVTVRPETTSSSLGPLVSKLAELLGDNLSAFLLIGKNGSTTFTISLKSTPPGASISYKRIGEAYQDYSRPTNVNDASFPYALWTFRFTLGKCQVVKNPNPYVEQNPHLSVSMQNCPKL